LTKEIFLQAMRGVALVVVLRSPSWRRSATFDDSPMRDSWWPISAWPSEHSSGSSIRRGGITKAGNVLALIEGAWTYRMPARVSRKLHDRNEKLPPAIRDIAWKGQLWLCARYRRLAAAGKPKAVVTTAIAREMVGFIWAIARIAQPVLQGWPNPPTATQGGRQQEIRWCALPATGPRWGTLLACYEPVCKTDARP
jgi:transposase